MLKKDIFYKKKGRKSKVRKSKKTSIIGIIITIIILVVIVIVSNIKIENLTQLESSVGVLVIPIQNGLTYLKNWISRKQ